MNRSLRRRASRETRLHGRGYTKPLKGPARTRGGRIMDFCLNLDGAKEIDIEDDDDTVVATFRIWEDEHGWLWAVSYADKRKATRVGRL